jgi:RimJ/RimL family protein N-acetyltransferase
MNSQLPLTDGKVLIRPYRDGDVALLYEAVRSSIPEVSPWMPWCHKDYTIEESRIWVESRPEAEAQGTEYAFVIADPDDKRFLGGCGLNQFHPVFRFANLGYWIRSDHVGQGLATAATKLLARYGFDHFGLARIEILMLVNNIASQRVAEKAGAVREGLLRNRIVHEDISKDAVLFSLIPEDLR